MKEPYGFSSLFEAMNAQRELDKSNDVINDIAFGTMEGASVIGDDITDSLGIPEDGVETGADDYMDEVDDVIEDDEDLKALDKTLDNIVETEDDDVALEALDQVLESIIMN